MTYKNLKELLLSKPFEPTRFVFSDGSVREIRHREFMMIGRSFVVLATESDEADIVDNAETWSLRHLVRVEPLATTAS